MSAGASGNPVEIYRARSLQEAYALRLALEDEGVPARIDNEMLQNAVGELPGGWATAPRILVEPADAVKARAILEKILQRAKGLEERDGTPMRCLACGEPMGNADACPACGWTFHTEAGEPPEAGVEATPPEAAKTEQNTNGPEPQTPLLPAPAVAPPLPLSSRALWAEVGAVLAVGFVPSLLTAISPTREAPLPYWIDTVELTVLSCCTAFVTLYLISRSGEPRTLFGLTMPTAWDVATGFGLFLAPLALWWYCCGLIRWDGAHRVAYPFSLPTKDTDYLMMVVKYTASCFAEEIVFRAYLISRFERLLGSRWAAVVLSAALFSVGHHYQGVSGVVYTMGFGLIYGTVFVIFRRFWPLVIGHVLSDIYAELMM